jgi:hypothetical protein
VARSKPPIERPAQQDPAERALALLPRAATGDQRAVASLRELFDEHPAMWDVVGDAAYQAQSAMVHLVAGKNAVVQDAIKRKLGSLQRELAGEAPSPLERLLAERVAACWLMLSHAEARYAKALEAPSVSFELSEYHQRRCERAQRRYIAAIKALAQVRRLLGPVVQVNIAERQVNVAQSHLTARSIPM